MDGPRELQSRLLKQVLMRVIGFDFTCGNSRKEVFLGHFIRAEEQEGKILHNTVLTPTLQCGAHVGKFPVMDRNEFYLFL